MVLSVNLKKYEKPILCTHPRSGQGEDVPESWRVDECDGGVDRAKYNRDLPDKLPITDAYCKQSR